MSIAPGARRLLGTVDPGVEVVDGACPLMFAEPVAWFHRLHRAELHITGRLAST